MKTPTITTERGFLDALGSLTAAARALGLNGHAAALEHLARADSTGCVDDLVDRMEDWFGDELPPEGGTNRVSRPSAFATKEGS